MKVSQMAFGSAKSLWNFPWKFRETNIRRNLRTIVLAKCSIVEPQYCSQNYEAICEDNPLQSFWRISPASGADPGFFLGEGVPEGMG